jgi:hypothetical protein
MAFLIEPTIIDEEERIMEVKASIEKSDELNSGISRAFSDKVLSERSVRRGGSDMKRAKKHRKMQTNLIDKSCCKRNLD